jgi:hypothetical protein
MGNESKNETQKYTSELQIDGLKLYANRPDQLISTLFRTEKIILSILGIAEKPLQINGIREAYIDRIFYNIAKNLYLDSRYRLAYKLLSGLKHPDTPNPFQISTGYPAGSEDAKRAERVEEMDDIGSRVLDGYVHQPAKVKEKIITWFYRDVIYKKKIRKVPFLIWNGTIKKYVEDLERMALVESRLKETLPTYYLNGEFGAKWLKQRRIMENRIRAKPEENYSIEELVFYGLENALLDVRIQVIDEILTKLIELGNSIKSKEDIKANTTRINELSDKFERIMGGEARMNEYSKSDQLFRPTLISTLEDTKPITALFLAKVLLGKNEEELRKLVLF